MDKNKDCLEILPLVSIIVPCYNQKDYISDTLNSVINSTYKNWECIVVDDGSTDNSKDIAQEYCKKDSRIKYLCQENAGVSAARNNGIAHSSGEYILPLDADDLIAPSYIEKAVKEFEHNPKLKLVYCNAKKIGAIKENWVMEPYDYQKLLWKEDLIFVSGIYKRKDFEKTAGYNVNMAKGKEDWDFYLSFLKPDDSVFCINEFLFFYRIKKVSRAIDSHSCRALLYSQIYKNHKDLYAPYAENIILYYNDMLEAKNIVNSYSYRVGHLLLTPFRLVKRMFHL